MGIHNGGIGRCAIAHATFRHVTGTRGHNLATRRGTGLRDIGHRDIRDYRRSHSIQELARGTQRRVGHDIAELIYKLKVLACRTYLARTGYPYNDLCLCGQAQDTDTYNR